MSSEHKSIYEKLQTARVALAKSGLKKGGQNTFSKYSYFELTDFLAKSDELLLENRLTPSFNFVDNLATLILYDWDSDNKLEWSTNGADATTLNKSGQPSNLEIQTLGSTHTYLKRYLYMHMMNVAENDGIEANTGNPETTPKKSTQKNDKHQVNPISKEQITEILELYGERVENMLNHYKLDKLQDMDSSVAAKLIEIEKSKPKTQDEPKTDEPIQEQVSIHDIPSN